jgi:hypothetical protein
VNVLKTNHRATIYTLLEHEMLSYMEFPRAHWVQSGA